MAYFIPNSKKVVVLIELLLILFITNNRLYSQNCDTLAFCEIENLPEFNYDVEQYIKDHINFSNLPNMDSIQGTIYLVFTIQEDGTTANHKIVKGIRKDLDEEVLRVGKTIVFKKGAMNNGKPIQTKFVLPIKFISIKDKKR